MIPHNTLLNRANVLCYFFSGEIKSQHFEEPPKHLLTNIKESPNNLMKLRYTVLRNNCDKPFSVIYFTCKYH